MVSEVQPTPPVTIESLPTRKKMVAANDYDPLKDSPNSTIPNKLSFRTGDIIYVLGEKHENGFYDGELENGTKGLVSSNHLKESLSEPAVAEENKVSCNSTSSNHGDGSYKLSSLPKGRSF